MRIKSLFAVAALLIASVSHAAYVTINEAGMDGVFSQSSFGNNKVDIRIGALTQLVFPDLLDITSDAEIGTLFGKHVGPSNVVNFYFVDTISACGGTINSGIIGCGEVSGQDFVVESVWAANNVIQPGGISFGVQLLAHELGHNLGMGHRTGNNLMNPSINGYQDLNASEVNTILASPLVQSDANGLFILINPVLILAADNTVPEPSTMFLMLTGLLVVRTRARNSTV